MYTSHSGGADGSSSRRHARETPFDANQHDGGTAGGSGGQFRRGATAHAESGDDGRAKQLHLMALSISEDMKSLGSDMHRAFDLVRSPRARACIVLLL